MAKTDVADLLKSIEEYMPNIVAGATAVDDIKRIANSKGKTLTKEQKDAIRATAKYKAQYDFKEQRRRGQGGRWANFKENRFGEGAGSKNIVRGALGAAKEGIIGKISPTWAKNRERKQLARAKYEEEQYKKFAKAKETQAEKDRKLQEQRDKETAAEQKAEALRRRLMEERAQERRNIQQERDNRRAGRSAGGIALPNANGSFGGLSLSGPAGSRNSALGGRSSGGIVEVNDDDAADILEEIKKQLDTSYGIQEDTRGEIAATNKKLDKLLGAFIDNGEANRDQLDAQFSDGEREEAHTRALATRTGETQSSYLAKIASDMSSLKDCFGNQCGARSGGGGGDAGGPGIFDRLADLFTGGVAGGAAGGVAGGAGKKMFDLLKRGVKGGIKGVKAGGPTAAGAAIITEIVQQVDSTKDAKIDSETGRMKGAESGIIGDVIKGITGVEVPNVFQGTFNAGLDFNDWWKGEGSFKDKKKLEELQGRIKLLSNGAKDENSSPEEVAAMSEQIENLKALQQASIDALKNEGVDGLQKFTTELIPEALKITEDLAIKLKERDIAEHKRKSEIVTSEEDIVKVYDDLIANMQATMGGKTDKSKELAIKSLLEQKQKALSTWSSNTLGIDSGAKPEPKKEPEPKPANVGAVTQEPRYTSEASKRAFAKRDEMKTRQSQGLQIGGESVISGQPFSDRQMSAISTGMAMSPANRGGYSQAILEQYEKQKSETVPLAGTRDGGGNVDGKKNYLINTPGEFYVSDDGKIAKRLRAPSIFTPDKGGEVFNPENELSANPVKPPTSLKLQSTIDKNLGLSDSTSASLGGIGASPLLKDPFKESADKIKKAADTLEETSENDKSILSEIKDEIKSVISGSKVVLDFAKKGVVEAFDAALEASGASVEEIKAVKDRIANDPDGVWKGTQRVLTGDRTDLTKDQRIKLITDHDAETRGVTTKSLSDEEKEAWAAKYGTVATNENVQQMVTPPITLDEHIKSIQPTSGSGPTSAEVTQAITSPVSLVDNIGAIPPTVGSTPQLSSNPADPTAPTLTSATESASSSSSGTLSGLEANPEYKQIVEDRIAQKIAGGMTKEDARQESQLEVKDEIVKGNIRLKSAPQIGAPSESSPSIASTGSPVSTAPGSGSSGPGSSPSPVGMSSPDSSTPPPTSTSPLDILDPIGVMSNLSGLSSGGPGPIAISGMGGGPAPMGVPGMGGGPGPIAISGMGGGPTPMGIPGMGGGPGPIAIPGMGGPTPMGIPGIGEPAQMGIPGIGEPAQMGMPGAMGDNGELAPGETADNAKELASAEQKSEYLSQSQYKDQFAGLAPGSEDFNKKWKQLSSSDPNFEQDRRKFIKTKRKKQQGQSSGPDQQQGQGQQKKPKITNIGSEPVNARPSKAASGPPTVMMGGGGGGGGGGSGGGGMPGVGNDPTAGMPGSTGGVGITQPQPGVGGVPSIGTPSTGGSPTAFSGSGGGGTMPSGYQIGDTVAPYESGGGSTAKRLGTIGDVAAGNPSYGRYQIETKHGTMKEFLNYTDKTNPELSAKLRANSINSAGFQQTWKDQANNNTAQFQEAQHGYIKQKKYDPALAHAQKLGFKTDDPRMQEALWSASIQHGGVKKVLDETVAKNKDYSNMSSDDQIKALYKARGDYSYRNIKGSEKYKRAASYERYDKEVKDVLAMKTQPGGPGQMQPGAQGTPGVPPGAPQSAPGGQMQPVPGSMGPTPGGGDANAALGDLSKSRSGKHVDVGNLKSDYATNLSNFRKEAEQSFGRKLSVESGYRPPTEAEKRALGSSGTTQASLQGKGKSGKVASVYGSKHGTGQAADMKFEGMSSINDMNNMSQADREKWVALAQKHNLDVPLRDKGKNTEWWHVEEKGLARGGAKERGQAYTDKIQSQSLKNKAAGGPGAGPDPQSQSQQPNGQLQPQPGQQPGGALAGAPAAPQSQADMLASQTEGMGDSQADQLAAQTAEFGPESAPGSGQLAPAPGGSTNAQIEAAGGHTGSWGGGGGGGGGMGVPDGSGGGGSGSGSPGIGSMGGTQSAGGTASASSPTETANTDNSVKRITDSMMIYGMA